jgi:hypothetical protein
MLTMSLLKPFHDEIRQAREQDREVHWIRVTKDAIPGSITTTPITPERARQIALRAEPGTGFGRDCTVDTDPKLVGRPPLEIVVHPEDWAELLKDPEAARWGIQIGEPDRVLGIPVTRG